MSGSSLRDLTIWLRLDRVNKIWEVYGILNEEDRDIVANDVYFLLA